MSNIEEKIEEALEQARACDPAKPGECAAAWDTVEELQAEKSHQKSQQKPLNSLQQYCSDNPDAAECRIYED
jgi:hypothetical protein